VSELRFTRRVAASAVPVLLDKEQLAAMQATMNRREIAAALGVAPYTLLRAMRYHEIECPPCVPPWLSEPRPRKPVRLTRRDVRWAVRRAYLRADRCPPDCPGRMGCLDTEAGCVLLERQGGAE